MYKFLVRPLPWRYLNNKSSSFKPVLKLSFKFSSTPRPPKDPPDEGYRPTSVDHQDIEVSDFVRPEAYRKFNSCDEKLGPGAGKSKKYKNAQYFGYHRYSYYELQNQSMELRDERRLTGGVQTNFGEDDEDECSDDSLEAMKEQEEKCEEALAAQCKDKEKAKLEAWCLDMEKKQENNRTEMEQKTIDKKVKERLEKATKGAEGKDKCEKPKEKEMKCEKTKEAADKCEKKDEKKTDKCDKPDKDDK